jgi:hypothetical protein
MSFVHIPTIKRRSLLRGMLGGGAVSVALPFLDCFLNTNGTALASGAPLPVRFGTWYWGLGLTPNNAVAERTSTVKGIEFLEQTAALKPHEDYINFYSQFNMPLDDRGCEHVGDPVRNDRCDLDRPHQGKLLRAERHEQGRRGGVALGIV